MQTEGTPKTGLAQLRERSWSASVKRHSVDSTNDIDIIIPEVEGGAEQHAGRHRDHHHRGILRKEDN